MQHNQTKMYNPMLLKRIAKEKIETVYEQLNKEIAKEILIRFILPTKF